MQGQGKSRRWRYGDYRRHKASARLLALWRGSGCDAVAACKPQAGEQGLSLAGAVAQRRRGRSSSADRRHKAVARLFARRRASSTRGGSNGAGLAGLIARPVTERSESRYLSKDSWCSEQSSVREKQLMIARTKSGLRDALISASPANFAFRKAAASISWGSYSNIHVSIRNQSRFAGRK